MLIVAEEGAVIGAEDGEVIGGADTTWEFVIACGYFCLLWYWL